MRSPDRERSLHGAPPRRCQEPRLTADRDRATPVLARCAARDTRRRFASCRPHSFTFSKSIPCSLSAVRQAIPSLSVRLRASFMSRCPEQAEEPKRLFPKRAPSSSAQSTRRTVIGGFPLDSALIRRRISRPASVFREPSSQPPLGTESMCPPMSSAFSDSPRNVIQRLPASSRSISAPSSLALPSNQLRAFAQTAVKATRCAPFASLVRRRSSFSSSIVRLGFNSLMSAPWRISRALIISNADARASLHRTRSQIRERIELHDRPVAPLLLDQLRHQTGPAGLMIRTQASSGVTVKVFMEKISLAIRLSA